VVSIRLAAWPTPADVIYRSILHLARTGGHRATLNRGLNVRAVALYGQTPTFLHRARALGGWRSQGAAANHPAATPPTPWASIGQCWAGTRHAVVDVTAQIAESSAAATGRNT